LTSNQIKLLIFTEFMCAKKKTQPPTQTKKEAAAEKRRADAEIKTRAFDLYERGWKQVRIAEELDVSVHCVGRWLRNTGRIRPPRESINPEQDPLHNETDASNPITEHLSARDAEVTAIAEVADNQASAADQYQAYVAQSGIRLLRDNIMNVRGPRTVRELSELDQLIRRSMGLNPKGGTGGGGLMIDISILNNAKASKSGTIVVDAEISSDEDGYDD
jgi:hypothetical protein